MPETIWNVVEEVALSERAESFTDRLEDIESSLWIVDPAETLSDDIKTAYFKIQSYSRWNEEDWINMQQHYEQVLKDFDALVRLQYESPKDYILATKDLLSDLWNIQTSDWRTLNQLEIDGWTYEMIVAICEWMVNATDKIYEELKALIDPEALWEMIKWLWELLSNPLQFMDTIIQFISEEASDIWRDIALIRENSSENGFRIEMAKYIPETALPIVFGMTSPWWWIGKIWKLLKLWWKTDKLPEWWKKKSKEVKKWWWDIDTEMEEISVWFRDAEVMDTVTFQNKLPDVQRINKLLNNPEELFKVLKAWRWRMDIFTDSINNMTDFLHRNMWILWNPNINQFYRMEYLRTIQKIKANIDGIKWNENINKATRKIFVNALRWTDRLDEVEKTIAKHINT